MNLKQLKNLLNKFDENYDDFEVELNNTVLGRSDYGLDIDTYKIIGVSDVGHSGKILALRLEEK